MKANHLTSFLKHFAPVPFHAGAVICLVCIGVAGAAAVQAALAESRAQAAFGTPARFDALILANGQPVTRPDSSDQALAGPTQVVISGTALTEWRLTSSMTRVRDWPAAAATDKSVYAFGGQYCCPLANLNSVERATINPDGSLGAWQLTSAMSNTRSVFAATVSGDFVYALAGEGAGSVEMAPINSDGSLGAWRATAAMLAPHNGLAAVSSRNYIYAIGGMAGVDMWSNFVEYAPIQPDGSLGAWQATSLLTIKRSYLAAALVGDYVYAIGGQNGDPGGSALKSVERAHIKGDGSLDAWQLTTPMSTRRCDLAAVAVGVYVYAFGGSTCMSGLPAYDSAERARVNADGGLDAWETLPHLTDQRWRHAAAANDRFIFVIGGEDGTGAYLNSVETATVLLHQFMPFVTRN